MINFKVGQKLPNDFTEALPEGMTGIFGEKILFVLKMEDLTKDDVEIFNTSKISVDLLELDMYKEKAGNLYAFSILVDGFIDNSEVMIDFRVGDIEELMPTSFKSGKGIDSTFILVDENDTVLARRDFNLGSKLSNIVSDRAYKQNQVTIKEDDENTDYVLLAFQKLFKNEPEENLKLFSIGNVLVK